MDDYYCLKCEEPFVADVIVERSHGETNIFVHCPCGSDRVIRIDDGFDAAEYKTGEKL